MPFKRVLVISLLVLGACSQQKQSPDKKLLEGSWFGEEYEEHAVFFFTADSMGFVEHPDKYKYNLERDTLTVMSSPVTRYRLIQASEDSLILETLPDKELLKYWKQ